MKKLGQLKRHFVIGKCLEAFPENVSSLPVFNGVLVTRSSVFYVVFCRSFFVILYFLLWLWHFLWFTASGYLFVIFWLPLCYLLITSLLSSGYLFVIFWLPLCYLLITYLLSSDYLFVIFWLPVCFLLITYLFSSDYLFGIFKLFL